MKCNIIFPIIFICCDRSKYWCLKKVKKGDNVVLILKPNGNLEMKKEKTNFWDEVSKMSAKEKRLQIEDLGYDPLEQRSKGRERIED